jgi:hypothetical protein
MWNIIDRSYAVTDPEDSSASGRVEATILFHTHFCTMCKNVCEKGKQDHAAAGESGFHRVKRPVCMATA